MAPIVDDARAARERAFRLCCDARELRHAAHAEGEISRLETRKAVAPTATAPARSLRIAATPSPWSGLMWLRDDEALHTVLLPVD